MTRTEHELPFERLSPRDFERLCVALIMAEGYEHVEHLGAAGHDRGVDIAAVREGKRIALQCKRTREFGPVDAVAAVSKVLGRPQCEQPERLVLIVTCDVSETARLRAAEVGGAMEIEVWALTELDQRVRRHPDLVAQFFGVPLPLPELAVDAVTMPPKLPPHYQARKGYVDEVAAALREGRGNGLTITGKGVVGLQGMAGIGKSVIAAAAAQRVASEFPDGVWWVVVGHTPDLLGVLRALAAATGARNSDLTSVAQVRDRMRRHLAGRRVLLVLDDVWTLEVAETLDVTGEGSRQLLTSRNSGLIGALGGREIRVDVLEPTEALELLAGWSAQEISRLPPAARDVAKECGYLPLALALAGALARRLASWEDVLKRLRLADLERLAGRLPGYPYPSLIRALEVSVDALQPLARERYLELAMFPDEVPIPEAAIATLWSLAGMDDAEVRELTGSLIDLSLAGRAEGGGLTLHDLQRDYIRGRAVDVALLHRRIVEAYATRCPAGFASGPDDGWFFQRLPWHLAAGQLEAQLRELLLSFPWLRQKLAVAGINALLSDFDLPGAGSVGSTVQTALRQCSHILSDDPPQLAGQLLGRLSTEDGAGIDRLLEQAKDADKGVWLRPRSPTLRAPSALLRTLVTGAELRDLVAIDDRRIVASTANGLEVWDVAAGELLCTRAASAVTLAHVGDETVAWQRSDGAVFLSRLDRDVCTGLREPLRERLRAAMAALTPGRIALWFQRQRLRIEQPYYNYFDQAPLPIVSLGAGRLAVARANSTVAVVEPQSGRLETVLPGCLTPATDLARVDDRHLVATCRPDRVVVWDLETRREVFAATVSWFGMPWPLVVAASPNGELIACATEVGSLAVWRWRTGECLLAIIGGQQAVAWLSANLLAVLGNEALWIWDAEADEVPVDLHKAQLGRPKKLAVVGKTLLASASEEGLVRVWDLPRLVHGGASSEADAGVSELVFLRDELIATASPSGRIRIWKDGSGETVATLDCEIDKYAAPRLCVLPSGALVISVGRALRIWNGEIVREIPLDVNYPVTHLRSLGGGRMAAAAFDTLLLVDECGEVRLRLGLRSERRPPFGVVVLKSLARTEVGLVWWQHSSDSLFCLEDGQTEAREVPVQIELWEIEPLTEGRIAGVGPDGEGSWRMVIVDLHTGALLREENLPDPRELRVIGVNRLIAMAESTLHVWDINEWKPLARFDIDRKLTSLTVAPPNDRILVAGADGVIHDFDLVG